MEYLWIFILVFSYFATWAYVMDELETSFSHDGIDFCKMWLYIHFVLGVIGIVGVFVYSLWLFIRK